MYDIMIKLPFLKYQNVFKKTWHYQLGYFLLHLVLSLVDFDKRYSTYPTPTYPSDSVSVAKNSIDINETTKSARNFICTLIHYDKCISL